jgi:hypothetical protein
MDNWHQNDNLTLEERQFNNSMLLNKFTYNLIKCMDGAVVNTEQFKMFQIQFSGLIIKEDLKKFFLSDKFITYLKNAGLIEHVKKKETPYKKKSSNLSYYKGMYFTSSDKGRLLLDNLKGKF